MRSTSRVALVAAAALAGAMLGMTSAISAGAQTFESVALAGRMTPTRFKRAMRPWWHTSGRKGVSSRRKKHSASKPIRSWRKARVLKLRSRK